MIISIITFIGLVILIAPVANKTGEAINNILQDISQHNRIIKAKELSLAFSFKYL